MEEYTASLKSLVNGPNRFSTCPTPPGLDRPDMEYVPAITDQ